MGSPPRVPALHGGISLATTSPKAKPPTLSIVIILKGCRVSTFEAGKPAIATVFFSLYILESRKKADDAVAMMLVSRIVYLTI